MLPLITCIAFAFALTIAVVRSNNSQVIIYNDTGGPLVGLTVKACGEETAYSLLDDQSSVRLRLSSGGTSTGVELSTPSNGWHWDGGYIEPRGGYTIFIHVRKGMEVETNTDISFWQQLLFGRNGGG